MAFPQQNLKFPNTIHLFVDDFDTLLNSGGVTAFLNDCQNSCINFLSLNNINEYSFFQLESFIIDASTNWNICDFATYTKLFFPTKNSIGLDDYYNTFLYNSTVTDNSRINWLTIDNKFWDLLSDPILNTSGFVADTIAGSTTVTMDIPGINSIAEVGHMILIKGEWRQIIQVNNTFLVVDRPFLNTLTKTSFTIRDNLSTPSYALDFTTFLYRLQLLRNTIIKQTITSYNINTKIEVVLTNDTKKLTPTQYNQIASFADRILMYDEINKEYPIYNDSSLKRVRQSLISATTNKPGTVSVFGDTMNGVGTTFTKELGIGTYVTINNNQYLIIDIVTDTQAIISPIPIPAVVPNTTYSSYIKFLPILDLRPGSAQSWVTGLPNKSFVDIYDLTAISGHTIGGVNLQLGNSPITYDVETNPTITGSTYMEGMSIFSKTNLDLIQGSIIPSPLPCSTCKTSPSPIINGLIITQTNPTCDSAANGSITVEVNGNNLTTPYLYELIDVSIGSVIAEITSNDTLVTFTGLTSYDYTVQFTENNGISFAVSSVQLTNTFNPTVQSTGNIIIFNISGGIAPYEIVSSPAGTFYVSGLTDGSYSYSASNGSYNFIINDSNSCSSQLALTVDNTRYLVINSSTIDPTCDTAADGKITININNTGDTSPYVYTYAKLGSFPINQVSFLKTDTYLNVTTGTWLVTASDVSGNTSNTISLTISNTLFNPTVSTVTNQATFILTGGTSPYTIVGNTIPSFNQSGLLDGSYTYTSLPNGSYIFTVTDVNGCSKNLPATFNPSIILTLNLSSYINPNCNATLNGQVFLSPNGGLPPYVAYSATNGTTNYTNNLGYFTGLTSDSWTFKVQDSVGTIASLGLVLIDTFNVNYITTGTTICVSASGGSLGNYTVVLNGTPYSYNTATTVNCYTGICGTNNIQVIDGNLSLSGCVYTASTFIVCPLTISLSATPVTCGGTNPTPNGVVQITTTNGLPPYEYNLYNQASPTLTNTTGLFSNLPLGNGLWTATTTDSDGTIITSTFSLEKPFFGWELYNSNYSGIGVTISGGSSPYVITISGPLQNTNNIFLQYSASTQGNYSFSAQTNYLYSVQVYDKYFCPSDNVTKTIDLQSQLLLGITDYNNPICTSPYGSVTLDASGGTTPYVSYSATNNITLYTSTSNIFSGLTSDNWTFYVQDSVGTIVSTNYNLLSSNDYTINTNVIYSSNTLDISLDTTYISASTTYVNVLNQEYPYIGNTLSVNYSGCGMVDIQACAYPPSNIVFTFPSIPNTVAYRSVSTIDGKLFGSTYFGGLNDAGIFFSADTYGNYETLYNFNGSSYGSPTQVGNFIYGTVFSGGIYKYNISNRTMSILPGSTSISQSYSKLTLASDSNFYGTLYNGYLFKYVISSDTVTVLHTFSSTVTDGYQPYTAPIEAIPGVLYGITSEGGFSGNGNYYKYILSSNTYVNLGGFSPNTTGGQSTIESLVLVNNKLYGTSNTGGLNNYGCIWEISLSSDTLTKLIDFPYYSGVKCITLGSDGKIYGTSSLGGNSYGTFFSYDILENKIKKLSNFTYYSSAPLGGVTELNNKFYGVSSGLNGLSTSSLFSVDVDPCCNQKSVFVNSTYTVDPQFTVNFLTGNTKELCVSIDTVNFFPPPYQVTIQNSTYPYDTNIDPNCYPITGCGINTIIISGTSCVYSGDVTVSCCPPLVLSVVGTTIPCSANTGVISVIASGGCPPYIFRLNNGQIVTTKTGTTNTIVTYSGLSPNSYRTLIIDSSGNTDTSFTMLSFISTILTIQDQDLCLNVSGANNVAHYVYIDNQLKYTSTGNIFNVCLTGLTGCGAYHTVKIVDSSTGCFFQKPYRINCRPYNIIDLDVLPPLCFNGTSNITLSVSGGSYPYTFQLERTSPSIVTISADTVVLNSPTYPYNYANFSVSPPSGTWVGKVTDTNGTVKISSNIDLTYICYSNVVFTPTNVTVSFSGAPDWTNVILNGVTYPFLPDGTYVYSVPCGYNEVIVQSISNAGSPPAVICTSVFSATTICPLWSGYMFDQPICAGSEIEFITVYVTGGTPDYRINLSNGVTTYTGLTSTSPFNFFTGGINPIDITGGTWTITTTDNNGNTYNQTINIDATFDAFASQLTTSGVFITVSGGTPLYNITIDSTDYGSNYGNGEHYFTATTGLHTAVVSQPFGSGTIPPPINCFPIYLDSGISDMYYFDTTTLTSNFYFSPSILSSLIFCRDNDNIWFATGTQINEYSTTTTPPTFVRSIDTTINNINPVGIYPWTSPNKLIILQAYTPALTGTPNTVQIIDISTNTATIDSTLYTIRPDRQFILSNLYRDNTNGLSYFMTQKFPGGGDEQYEAYYDNGTLYATGQTGVILYGSCLIGNQLYGIDFSGSFSSVTNLSGTFVFGSSPYSINNFGYGVAQAPECDSPTVQPTNTCPQTFNFRIPAKPISCNYIYTNPTCGNNIGSVLVTVTGGTGLFTYSITDGINTYTSSPPLSPYSSYPFNGLGPGTWQLSVIDSDGGTCTNTINLISNFSVSATSYSNNSYTVGNICVDIQGGTPPYNIFIDNIIRLSATTNLSNCFTATTNTTHTYRVEDSSPPCTIYVNDPIFQNNNFDTNTDWILNYGTSCDNPSINPLSCCTQQYFAINNGNLLYTGLTPASLSINPNGCIQFASARQDFIWPYGNRPIASTYVWEITTGLVSGISPGYAAFQLWTPWRANSINPTPPFGTGSIPFPGLQSNRTYGGTLILPATVYNVNPSVYSGYGFNLIISGGYSANTGGQGCKIEISSTQLTLVSYDIPCSCSASGTTFVSPTPSPQIGLLGFTNPSCESATNGIISVSGSSGVPPYVYSATNGTTNYTNINGIFNGLNSGTWYLSLVDSLGATATLAQPITLYDTFYADVDSYSNGYCVSITGGTQPYYVAVNGNPLNWNYNFDTNCYSATCNTTSVITVRDSS